MTRYAFVRFVICLITGILLSIYFDGLYRLFLIFFILFSGSYFILFILSKFFFRETRLNTFFSFLAFGIIMSFGYVLTYLETVKNDPQNIINDTLGFSFYEGIISADVREREKFLQTEVEIFRVKDSNGWHSVSGNSILNVRKSGDFHLKYGDKIIVKGRPQIVPEPLNPNQFNYKRYLSFQQVYHQHFINPNQVIILGNEPQNYFLEKSIIFRHYFDSKIHELVTSDQEYAIATGIVLGVRDVIDNETKQAYSAAGAMHVLAVSGMQVALLFYIFTLLFSKIKSVKYGNIIFTILVLFVLWFFAFVTGLSASVLRATVMFTFVVLAETFKRNTNIYNTLAVSAFTLLCYNPYLIMDVGFQLSYLALLGIVYLHNPIYQLITFKSKILDWFWSITCMSLAAQIGTFPISLLHFHQFPSYFLIANLFIIPISSGVLYVGLALLAVSWVPYLSVFIGFILKWMVWLLNQFVFITEASPGALITGIDINAFETIIFYLAILSILLLFKYRNIYYMAFSVSCFLGIAFHSIYETFVQKSQVQLAVFSINKHSILDLIEGQKHIMISDSTLLANEASWGFNLKNHWWSKGAQVKKATFTTFEDAGKYYPFFLKKSGYDLLVWKEKKIILFHEKTPNWASLIEKLNPDYVIIQNNSIKNLKVMADLKIKSSPVFIIDSSNSFYNAQKIKNQAGEFHLNCHAVGLNGAFLLEN